MAPGRSTPWAAHTGFAQAAFLTTQLTHRATGVASKSPDRPLVAPRSVHHQRLGPERPTVVVGHETVLVNRLAVRDRNDQVDIARPRSLGVEARRLSGGIRGAVVVADDVESLCVRLALDADVVAGIDLVAIAGALDDDVASSPHLRSRAFAARAEHEAADLVRVALGAVRPDGVERALLDSHLRP